MARRRPCPATTMRCPTCGERVRSEQQVCSFCGGVVADLSLMGEKPPSLFGTLAETKRQPQESVFGETELAEIEEAELEESETAPSWPTSPAQTLPPPPSPRPSLLLRLLLPLTFLLIPLLNFLLSDSPLNPWSRQKPVLQQAVFCESIQSGLPIKPKTVFSLRQDSQVVFYSLWSGSQGRQTYTLRWYTPGEKLYRTTTLLRFRLGRESFSTYTALPLQAGMSLGEWRIEISTGEEVQTRLSFQLRD